MAVSYFNYKVGRAVPLLTDAEWALIEPHLMNRISAIQAYRLEHGCSVAEASAAEPNGIAALAFYAKLTGGNLDHPDQLWSVRMADFGTLCPNCGRPFRTPKAKLCAECRFELPSGQVAGPLLPA